MKIVRKFMTLTLCAIIALITCVSSSVQQTYAASQIDWKIGIRFKLRAKNNYFYKDWWQIDLVCKNGVLSLEGRTDIPKNLMFDDIFIMGYNKTSTTGRTIFTFTTNDDFSASYVLEKEMQSFNRARIKVGDYMFMHGYYWDGTLRFADTDGVLTQTSGNDYAKKGYNKVGRWQMGFLVTENGLKENGFMQSKNYAWEVIQTEREVFKQCYGG